MRAPLIDRWRVFDGFKRGAAQAIRWAAESGSVEYDWLSENEKILDEAMELLSWASDYARLAANFIAWTRKAVKADVDAIAHRVRFTFDEPLGSSLLAADLTEEERTHDTYIAPVDVVRRLITIDGSEDWLRAGEWPSERRELA